MNQTWNEEQFIKKLDLSDFEFDEKGKNGKVLGKGSFASVHLAYCKANNKTYAIKIVT